MPIHKSTLVSNLRLLTFSPRRKAQESPWTLTSVSGHYHPFVRNSACVILYANLHAVLSSGCWGRSRVYMLGRTEGRASLRLCGYEGVLSTLVKTLQCSCWELPMRLPVAPHSLCVSKPNKFIGSPVGALMESYLLCH